ncbi:MAG: ribosomal-protein-alanine N-acetyltransferase [Saprospiraceae bacterium]|jgi:ribosomal-protein-alanine N-acetyltransferase
MIQTERLVIRKITSEDIHHIFSGLSHPDVIKYYGVSFMTLEATQEQMDWYADLEKNETGQWFAVCSKKNGTFYGAGGYNDRDAHNRKAEIGFWLLPKYWGKGIMAEAMPKIFDYGFDELKLHRIEGFVESTNENCKKAVDKVGFKYEGTMVDCEVKNGKFISVDIYAKFK